MDGVNLTGIALVKGASPGTVISFGDYESGGRVDAVSRGERAILRNNNGYFMQLRITSILDDSRKASRDEVVFDHEIALDGRSTFTAL